MTIAIIEENQREGLVLQPSNTRDIDFVCSCCGCCCGILTNVNLIVGTTNNNAPISMSIKRAAQGLIQPGVEVTDDAKAWLAATGYDPAFGARPLRRTIQRHIQDALSDLLIAADHEVGLVRVSVRQGQLHFEEVQEAEITAPTTV